MKREVFIDTFGAVFEHSAWVAKSVFDKGVDQLLSEMDTDGLSERFRSVFLNAPPERQLATLRAHPQLACALAEPTALTHESASEQSGAGLDRCSESEYREFGRLNNEYMEKFGFPFIIAVKGLERREILDTFRKRLTNNAHQEYQTALAQVCRIARFRIGDILDG